MQEEVAGRAVDKCDYTQEYFRCVFEFNGKKMHIDRNSMEDFVFGFWLTIDMKFTRRGNHKHFIVPHAIDHITRMPVSQENDSKTELGSLKEEVGDSSNN